ncbi:MAG: hypothetical protein LC792_07990 [Actinobacteria bacterium]|nr:hypothetical protein [Actinomycetota bacterium]
MAMTVGSAIDRSGLASFGRLPALDLAEAIRARAVAPAALASEVRLGAVRRFADPVLRRLVLPVLSPLFPAAELPLALLLPLDD